MRACMRIAIAMDHRQDAGDGEEERQQQQQQLGDLETDKQPVQKQGQLSPSSSWRAAAAASIRESLSRSLSSLSHQQEEKDDDEVELRWAAVGRLPTMDRLHTSLQLQAGQRQVVDVRRLGAAERRMVVDALVANIHRDNLRLLRKQRQRMDRVGVRPPTVEVRWRDVRVEAECQVVHGKPLPTIWNAVVSGLSVRVLSFLHRSLSLSLFLTAPVPSTD